MEDLPVIPAAPPPNASPEHHKTFVGHILELLWQEVGPSALHLIENLGLQLLHAKRAHPNSVPVANEVDPPPGNHPPDPPPHG